MATAAQIGDAAPSPPDEALIREALNEAQVNALRMALYQQTRDPELASMKVETYHRPGMPFLAYVVAREHHDQVREKAFQYLTSEPREQAPLPSYEETLDLMDMFQGGTLDRTTADYGVEELAFEGFSRDAKWTKDVPQSVRDNFLVTIVGSGFSGLATAIQLKRLGIPFRIIERQAGIGGTWFLNDYPQARVDITSFIYQYTFIKYPWKSYFATQPELREYVDFIVDTFDLRRHIELNTKVTDAHWDEAAQSWVIDIERAGGKTETFSSNTIVSAAGLFSTPRLPDIPGIETFEGKMFHTTAWEHDYDYKGKRVALIGTGSTGSQLMVEVAEGAAQLDVYQRTPNWVTPMPHYHAHVSPGKRYILDNMPFYSNWFSYGNHVSQLQNQRFQRLDREWQAKGGRINEQNDQIRNGMLAYIEQKVGHRPDLMAKLIPEFAPLSRRLVVDNGWYDTLLRDNVALLTDGIETITPDGITSGDGTHRAYDLIILGAGFRVAEYLFPVDYKGRDGATLGGLWDKDGGRAYLTTALPGFPNFFMMYGPNAGTRAGSFHSWAEVMARYICSALIGMIEQGASSIEVKDEAYRDYNRRLDEGLKTMLWEEERGGGGSYYINQHGRTGVNMPWSLEEFHSFVRIPEFDDYILR